MGIPRQTSNISRALAGNKIVDHLYVVGASPVGAAPTISSFYFNTRLHWIGQRQLQDDTRINEDWDCVCLTVLWRFAWMEESWERIGWWERGWVCVCWEQLGSWERGSGTGDRGQRTEFVPEHYSDIIMGAMASQITNLTTVYSNVYSGAFGTHCYFHTLDTFY